MGSFCTRCGSPLGLDARCPNCDPARTPSQRRAARLALIGFGIGVVALAAMTFRASTKARPSTRVLGETGETVRLANGPGTPPERLWRKDFPDGVIDVARVGDTVVVLSTKQSGGGTVSALEANTGRSLWDADTDAAVSPFALQVTDDAVIVASNSYDQEESPPIADDERGAVIVDYVPPIVSVNDRVISGVVEAFAIDTGRVRWVWDEEVVATIQVAGDTVVAGVFLQGDSTSSFGIDIERGTTRWDASGIVMAATADFVLAYDYLDLALYGARDGEEKWRDRVGDNGVAVFHQDSLFVGSDSTVQSISLDSFRNNWSRSSGAGAVLSLFAAPDGSVVVDGDDGLSLIDADGDLRWEEGSAAYALDVVEVGGEGRVVLAEATDGGTRLSVVNLEDGAAVGAPRRLRDAVVLNGAFAAREFFALSDRRVRAIRLDDLTESWELPTNSTVSRNVWILDEIAVLVMGDTAVAYR